MNSETNEKKLSVILADKNEGHLDLKIVLKSVKANFIFPQQDRLIVGTNIYKIKPDQDLELFQELFKVGSKEE